MRGEAKIGRRIGRLSAAVGALGVVIGGTAATLQAQEISTTDPRVGLRSGWDDAGQAISNLELVAHLPRPEGFFNPENPTGGGYSNTDWAFRGDLAFLGNYNGIQIYDIADPERPRLLSALVCPGGQGDVSIHGDLLFMSVQDTRARIDCGTQGVAEAVSPERFRGVRVFDVSDPRNPQQVAAVQSCRGSHTHTLVTRDGDEENVYVYISGTSVPRPREELEGCTGPDSQDDPNTSYSRIEVVQVPLGAPETARIVNEPRVFADPATGALAGLWQGGDHGPGTQRSRQTTSCHDITTYPEIGLAAGACSGNGILFDISDPVEPVRLDVVVDPSFSFWHSATFNNDGSKVLFTDEWGGGSSPRCRAEDPPTWGANAIFNVVGEKLQFGGYYKMPAAQTETENCVAHNGSLIPIPGRDIKVQGWYQGGLSIFDFTDASSAYEIAYFDRGPISDEELTTGGYWSTYWYNGYIYGSEILRGVDVFELVPSAHVSQNELDAAKLVRYEEFNAQLQPRVSWPPAFVVAQAYLDQLARNNGFGLDNVVITSTELDRIEALESPAERRTALLQLASEIEAVESVGDPARVALLATTIRSLGNVQ